MAARIAATVPADLLRGTLVPVPPDARRLRARGVDHAGLLAREIARRTGAPLAPVLVRAGRSERQAHAGRRDRLASGRIDLVVRGTAPVQAILVDDVHTTGATLDSCARALRAAGAHTVTAIAFARTLR